MSTGKIMHSRGRKFLMDPLCNIDTTARVHCSCNDLKWSSIFDGLAVKHDFDHSIYRELPSMNKLLPPPSSPTLSDTKS